MKGSIVKKTSSLHGDLNQRCSAFQANVLPITPQSAHLSLGNTEILYPNHFTFTIQPNTNHCIAYPSYFILF